jgi:hypothetical protein
MTTPQNYLNPFFNRYNFQPEQELYQDLLCQAVQMAGIEIYYIPRNIVNFDKIYETDDQSSYTNAIETICYLESIDGFGGQKDIFSKFGLEIRDQITVTIPKRIFDRTIKPISNSERPDEGDLIYFKLNQKCFQVKFTNNKEIFYPLGVLPLYRLTCELFEYSNETFNTEISEIDSIQTLSSLNILDNVVQSDEGSILTDENGNRITLESYDVQNIDIITDEDTLNTDVIPLVSTSESNPFGFVS